MIELVLVYCLSASPDRCLERREPLVPPISMMGCTMTAQTTAQDYLRSHPLYRLASWRCEMDKPREDPA
jgi:hypothetical protein